MTAAQIIHFFIVVGLGILAFLTFIVAGTILGLMIVEDMGCDCVQYPVGLYVLGLLGLLMLIGVVLEIVEGPFFTAKWINDNLQQLIIALLILFALLLIL